MTEAFENFTIEIEDDFDLAKIADSGQCFRVKPFEDGTYRFITGNNIIYIQKIKEGSYAVCCQKGSWKNIWTEYFDLSRNYRNIRERAIGGNDFVGRAAAAGSGIRLLRQDTWEMLITFIISQRKSIPAIAKAVENLSAKYGKEIETSYETLYRFPTPEELCHATMEELAACGLGYRSAYVMDAIEQVSSGALNMSELAACGDEELFARLLNVKGVGKKVANCVCLFGYGRVGRVPVDVWINRAIIEECQGRDPFEAFGENAGIIQQYVFYYERNQHGRKNKLV